MDDRVDPLFVSDVLKYIEENMIISERRMFLIARRYNMSRSRAIQVLFDHAGDQIVSIPCGFLTLRKIIESIRDDSDRDKLLYMISREAKDMDIKRCRSSQYVNSNKSILSYLSPDTVKIALNRARYL